MLFQFFGGGMFQTWERWGVFDALLPFALVFTVVYGILRKIKIFGDTASNRLDVVVALATATAFVYPHLSGRYSQWGVADPVAIINSSIPQVGVIIIAVVMFLILIGLLGFSKGFGALQQLTALLAFFVVGYIFLNAAGYLNFSWLWFMNNPDIQAFIVIALVLGGLLYFLGESREPKPPFETLGKALKNLIGEPK